MNNQENQPGSSMPGDDTRNQNAGASTGSAGAARKGGAAAGQARGASSQSTTASTDREPSDQNAITNSSSQKEGTDQQGSKVLNTAIESGKKWIEDSSVLNGVNDLPQAVKNWSSRAASRVGGLTTTQKLVGGALLAVGIGYLATRKNSSKEDKPKSRYGRQSGSSYGRSSGYQAPDASNSRRTSVGSGRSDSGSAYGNSSTSSYGAGASTGSGFGSTTPGSDASARTSESSYRSKNDDFRSVE